jgi:transcriptional regulator with XRE-family HTH domain
MEQANNDLSAAHPEAGAEVSDAIWQYREKKQKNNKRPSLAAIAKALGLSLPTLWNYRKGNSIPPPEITKAMAELFFRGDPGAGRHFQERLDAFRNTVPKRNGLDQLALGKALRVLKSDFPPFSGAIVGFFDRLCELSTLKPELPAPQTDSDLSEALWKDEIDIAVGYFSTLDRGILVHSWSTPIRIGIGAVILKQYAQNLPWIQEVLCGSRLASRSKLHPIVVREDGGEIHCRHTLGYQNDELKPIENLNNPREQAGLLVDALEKIAGSSTQIPVVIVNEYSCFEVLRLLKGKGISALPLSSRQAAGQKPRIQLPLFFLGLGCSRRQHDLRDMMEQALTLFLGTEVESTSDRFVELHKQLLAEVKEIAQYFPKIEHRAGQTEEADEAQRFQAAFNWTLYVLGLDELSIESYSRGGLPWRTILKRTRSKVMEQLAQDKSTLEKQIGFFWPARGALSELQFNKLCESFDLHPKKLTEAEREYVLEDRAILLRTIQNLLREKPIGLPIEEEDRVNKVRAEPLGEDRLRLVADGFLAELQKLYKQQVDEDVVEGLNLELIDKDGQKVRDTPQVRVEKFRRQIRDKQFGGPASDERVVLACVGDNSRPRYIGFACVKPYKKAQDCLELFYLWVPSRYRKLNVAEQIIAEARRFAEEQAYKYLVIEVLQTMNDMATYFLKRGFENDGSDKHGRLIFKLPIAAGAV